ncbi:MAG TPA: hypothetical protein VMV10_26990 [Pirellulales bacterium]|nr:hypothetical protein [Pirellulales bacterium]
MSDEYNETPWTERQWEAFFRESELRSARFGELFETLRDHPDRDELIDREMGWDRDDEEPEFESPPDEELESEEEDEEELEREKSDPSDLPAYAASFAWGRSVLKLLKNVGDLETDLDETVSRAIEGCLSVAAKIAAGSAMGEEDQSLCGNIVCCKRAAAFAEQGIEALEELAQRGCFPREALQPLVAEGQRVRLLVEERIGELRSRVWWE